MTTTNRCPCCGAPARLLCVLQAPEGVNYHWEFSGTSLGQESLWTLVVQWREAAAACRTPPMREENALLWDRVADELRAVLEPEQTHYVLPDGTRTTDAQLARERAQEFATHRRKRTPKERDK
jgi:hypothetical protein